MGCDETGRVLELAIIWTGFLDILPLHLLQQIWFQEYTV